MSDNNKVAVEITLEEKAALAALTQLSKDILKTEQAFTSMGNNSTVAINKSTKSIREAEEAFKKGLSNIGANTKATSQEIKNYEERTKKAAEESQGFFGGITQGGAGAFKTLVGGVTVANLASSAIIGTLGVVKDFVTGSVNAAVEQENAINRMNQALKASGDFSQRASEDFLDFASEMQKVSIYGDEVVVGQIAVAKSFGATNEQAKQLVQAAANLSATFGGSLDSNVEKLGKTFSGNAGKLAQYIPELKALTEEQLKSGAAFDIVNKKFSGAAANELSTYQGSVIATTNAYSDLQEELGRLVTENVLVTGALSVSKTSFEGLNVAVRTLNQSLGLGLTPLMQQRIQTSELAEEYNTLVDRISAYTKQKEVAERTSTGEASSLEFIQGLTVAITESEARKNQILKERQALRTKDIADAKANEEAENKKGGNNTVDAAGQAKIDARILKEKETIATIAMIREQAALAEQEQQSLVDATNLGNKDLEIQQIYEFEALKLEASFQAEEAKAALIKDSSEKTLKMKEIQAKRELDFTKLGNAQIRAENAKKEEDTKRTNKALLSATDQFLSAGAALARDGSNAQKGLQITQATISTYTAANNALAQPVPYPVAVAMAAAAVATGLANVARIAGAKFANGGVMSSSGTVVPGTSYTGDKLLANVNSGEAVLNQSQITNGFMKMVNGGGSSVNNSEILERLISAIQNQTINLVCDGRVLATVIRGQVRSGFSLA